jgi:hypothetical protein
MKTKTIQSVNLDANETIFFARELESIKAKSYDVVYPQLKARVLIPVSHDAGPGAMSITYYQYDSVGVAKIISSYAKDLPRVDVKGESFTSTIKSIGASYGYNVQEIRAAQMAGKPLEQRRANAAHQAVEQEINRIGFNGDTEHGLQGLIGHPNITTDTVAADGAGGGGSQTEWVNKTADQIIRDMNDLANGIVDLTNGVEIPDTLAMPIAQYSYIASTPRSSTSDTTILDFFLKNNPHIKEVTWCVELKGAGTSGVDIMIAYKRDPDKLTLEIPQEFEQFPPQESGLEFEVPCHARCGGVIVYYPLSISVGEGI